MKKKMFVVLALVLSLSLVLMACGGSKDDANSGDSKVLNVWAMGDEAKSLKELAQKFTKDTGIEVKVQVIPWANAHDKLLTAVASKSGPDVVQMGTTWMPEFVEAGALLDITKDVEKSKNMNSDLFFPGSVKTTQFDGKTYGVPWYAETRVLFYRTDLLKKLVIMKLQKHGMNFLTPHLNFLNAAKICTALPLIQTNKRLVSFSDVKTAPSFR